jgi:hypothetical protein
MKIYTAQVPNDCRDIIPSTDTPTVAEIQFNTKPLLNDWVKYTYEFHELGKEKSKRPDIWTIGGALALRSDLKEKVFPELNEDLEFLPIRVSEEDWFVVNCMTATKCFDESESVLYSGPEKQIFMIIQVVITDSSLAEREIFVLDGSNRATLLIFPSFVERIAKLKLNGLSFQEVGYVREDLLN